MAFTGRACFAFLAVTVACTALGQGEGFDPSREQPPPATTQDPNAPPVQDPAQPQPGDPQTPPDTQPQAQPSTGDAAAGQPGATPAAAPPIDPELLLDGHVRSGPFLAGPGSLGFVLHHSLMGAAGGLVTMGIGSGFRLDQAGAREAMLAGTLIGAGLGFGVSAWWQFNHWLDSPVAFSGIVNSMITGMALTGLVDFFTDDKPTLAWTALIGAELGAWMTIGFGGGEMPLRRAVGIASGAMWGMIYTALMIAIIGTSSGFPEWGTMVDTLMVASGGGALAMALASNAWDPSVAQVLRADVFGAGIGAAVLLLSGLVLGGFDQSTPYVLTLLASAGAITAVSVFWVEAAEKGSAMLVGRDPARVNLYRSKDKDRPYSNPWW